jgi:hypothetical protein
MVETNAAGLVRTPEGAVRLERCLEARRATAEDVGQSKKFEGRGGGGRKEVRSRPLKLIVAEGPSTTVPIVHESSHGSL